MYMTEEELEELGRSFDAAWSEIPETRIEEAEKKLAEQESQPS